MGLDQNISQDIKLLPGKSMNKALITRSTILKLAHNTNEGHIPSSFSIVEIMMAVKKHQEKVNSFSPQNLVLSKGHASFGYYAFLHAFKYFSESELKSVCKLNSKFYGHLPFLENDKRFHYGSGSLGHGLPYAVGLAFAKLKNNSKDIIYCIVGDGEANEGTFWESLLILKKFSHINLKIIIDQNNSSERAIPITSFIENIKNLYDKKSYVSSVDGHSIDELVASLDSSTIIIANTVKGYPLSNMMSPMWHHKSPSEEELISLQKDLEEFYK
tara:strand:- start:1861 stop:2676 length:816 start_codon:yes stop_codon:yes gene_type:complete